MPDAAQPAATNALDVLSDCASAVARSASLDAILRRLLDVALAASGAERGAILVQDPENERLELAAASGFSNPALEAVIASAGGQAALDDAASRTDGRIDEAADSEAGGRRVSLLPLVTGHDGIDRLVGMLTLERSGGPLDAAGGRLLGAIADLAATAIDRAQIRSVAMERADWFERLAASDPLTGLANRHVLDRVLEHELTRAGRQGSEVSVAIFDVDAFRATNEEAGREVGDHVLREVAAAIAGTVRLVDTVARLGGDEFVVVAPGSAGLIVARRVMDAINRLSLVLDRTVSVSAGVARFPIHGATPDQLLQAALHAVESAQGAAPGGLVEAAASLA